MKRSFTIPIIAIIKSNHLKNHVKRVVQKADYKVLFLDRIDEIFWNILKNTSCIIIFVESYFLKSDGVFLYDEIFDHCPEAKVVLLCSEKDRELIKFAIEKGGYGSIIEPYDPWEIITIIKHLTSDLTAKLSK